MFSKRTLFIILPLFILAFLGCQNPPIVYHGRIPGIYHIRVELGNSSAGKQDEIYLDFDSTKKLQTLNHFVYDEMDSIVFNKTYDIKNEVMDSLFLYSVATIRNDHIFEVNKFAPTDGHYVFLEVIANAKMIQCSYSNISQPSLASEDLGKLIKLINSSTGENTPLIK